MTGFSLIDNLSVFKNKLKNASVLTKQELINKRWLFSNIAAKKQKKENR
jgi:hypothetical protein